MKSIVARCCAKINLTLDVMERRPDGYHSLSSVMQSINLGDSITVGVGTGGGIEVTCSDSKLPAGVGNTVYSACRLFSEAVGYTDGITAHVEKHVPSQAGLGGGSSDAAGTLLALNSLFGSPLSSTKLTGIAAEIGSDVPFFLTGGTALVKGRGEIVEKLDDLPLLNLVIVKPDAGVPTAWAYKELTSARNRTYGQCTAELLDAAKQGNTAGIIGALGNDFELVVLPAYPTIVAARLALLNARAEKAMLCGSGASVFGVFGDEESARKAVSTLKGQFQFVEFAQTTNSAIELGEEIDS